MQKDPAVASFLLASWGRARQLVPKPGKRNIFRHERRTPATGRIQYCITGKEWLTKVPVKQTVEKDPVAAWFLLASWGCAASGAETRDKKHLQARAKTPCYREDSELHHGEGVVNKSSCKTDC